MIISVRFFSIFVVFLFCIVMLTKQFCDAGSDDDVDEPPMSVGWLAGWFGIVLSVKLSN